MKNKKSTKLLANIILFLTLIETLCMAKIIIDVNKVNGSGEIEDAALKLLKTCFGNDENTIVLLGEMPKNFIEKLSSHQSLSIVVLDSRIRAEKIYASVSGIDYARKHKVKVIVMTATYRRRSLRMLRRYVESIYDDSMAYVLILSWSNEKLAGGELNQTVEMMYQLNYFDTMNANVMVRNGEKGILLYTSNPFQNVAPQPWKSVGSIRQRNNYFRNFFYFARKHREDEHLCENLEFNRGRNIGRAAIPIMFGVGPRVPIPKTGTRPLNYGDRRLQLAFERIDNRIYDFIDHVNGTPRYWWKRLHQSSPRDSKCIHEAQTLMRAFHPSKTRSYPHGTGCRFLVTQFRGNKSQLRKLYDIIDGYSWIGMYIVYFITLIYLKYFLRKSVIAGSLDLCRLTSNAGIAKPPSNQSSRIYLGCLLFFVVTMQGIFVGNLAALLTNDVPLRQVNSFEDLIDLGYSVSILNGDSMYVNDPLYRGRFVYKFYEFYEDCIPTVVADPLNACLALGEEIRSDALKLGLHVSKNCVAKELSSHRLPFRWFLEEEFNRFLRLTFDTCTEMPYQSMVEEERLHEFDARKVYLEPKVMTMEDLGFSFAILGCGLAIASVAFIAELIIDRYQQRVRTTRVIFLK